MSKNRFHISKSGSPAGCVARVRSCPRGGEETYMSSLGLEGPARPSVRMAREYGAEHLYDAYTPTSVDTILKDEDILRMSESKDYRDRVDLANNKRVSLSSVPGEENKVYEMVLKESDERAIEAYKNSEKGEVRSAVYSRADLFTPDELSKLSKSRDRDVVIGVVVNPNTKEEDLRRLFKQKDHAIYQNMGGNKGLSEEFKDYYIDNVQKVHSGSDSEKYEANLGLLYLAAHNDLTDKQAERVWDKMGVVPKNYYGGRQVFFSKYPTEKIMEPYLPTRNPETLSKKEYVDYLTLMKSENFQAYVDSENVSKEDLVKLGKGMETTVDSRYPYDDSTFNKLYDKAEEKGFRNELGWVKEETGKEEVVSGYKKGVVATRVFQNIKNSEGKTVAKSSYIREEKR